MIVRRVHQPPQTDLWSCSAVSPHSLLSSCAFLLALSSLSPSFILRIRSLSSSPVPRDGPLGYADGDTDSKHAHKSCGVKHCTSTATLPWYSADVQFPLALSMVRRIEEHSPSAVYYSRLKVNICCNWLDKVILTCSPHLWSAEAFPWCTQSTCFLEIPVSVFFVFFFSAAVLVAKSVMQKIGFTSKSVHLFSFFAEHTYTVLRIFSRDIRALQQGQMCVCRCAQMCSWHFGHVWKLFRQPAMFLPPCVRFKLCTKSNWSCAVYKTGKLASRLAPL